MNVDPSTVNMDLCVNEFISMDKSLDTPKLYQHLPPHIVPLITSIPLPIHPCQMNGIGALLVMVKISNLDVS